MKNLLAVGPVLALAMLGTAGVGFAQGYGQPQQPYPQQAPQAYPQQQGQPGYGQDRDRQDRERQDHDRNRWDAPPEEMQQFARQGFQDGMMGARSDMERRRRPYAAGRYEYRHPNGVPRDMRQDYRMGFQRGYDIAMQHARDGFRQNGYGQPQRPY